MITDFAAVDRSVGVYPGGQSENAASPQYADQLPIWAKGAYLPLHMIGDRTKLPPEAKVKSVVFQPQ